MDHVAEGLLVDLSSEAPEGEGGGGGDVGVTLTAATPSPTPKENSKEFGGSRRSPSQPSSPIPGPFGDDPIDIGDVALNPPNPEKLDPNQSTPSPLPVSPTPPIQSSTPSVTPSVTPSHKPKLIPPPLPLSIPPPLTQAAALNNSVINSSGPSELTTKSKSKLSISSGDSNSSIVNSGRPTGTGAATGSSNNTSSNNKEAASKEPNHTRVHKRNSNSSAALTEEEEQATTEFLSIVNGARDSKGMSPISFSAAVKFLMARKFNVRRALELYDQHFMVRLGQGLVNFDPTEEPLRSELLSSKFTVLPTRDLGSAAIAIFSAKLHTPSTSPKSHLQTLQGLIYQLDCALENPQTQRSGLIFLYDMSDSKYSNFDYDLSVKILTLLKGSYPARLKKVLIVTAPLWFRAPFKFLRLFVREKLRDRVYTVSLPQLSVHIPNSSLPISLGGTLVHDHLAWIALCNKTLSTIDLWGSYPEGSGHDLIGSSKLVKSGSLDCEIEGSMSNGIQSILGKKFKRNGQSPSPLPNSSGSSGFSDDDSLPFDDRTGLTIPEFTEHLKQKGRRGLLDEYAEIISKSPEGSFDCSKARGNVSKNRYSDVLCFDHSRVVLSNGVDTDSDYINANFVDGYKQKNAFISTQGPLPRTFGDFWQMVWEQTCVLIVMTTRVIERGRGKCGQYWPPDVKSNVVHEGFKLENLDVDTQPDYAVTKLKLINTKTGESRTVTHLQFLSWPDYGVPSSAGAMLSFLERMRSEQDLGVKNLGSTWDGSSLGPPIIVHCSAGIGRTGTLCTMDICIKRLNDQGTVDVQGTVERIRSQRAYSIQVPEQYLFCHAAMIEYAKDKGFLREELSLGLPDLLTEDYN